MSKEESVKAYCFKKLFIFCVQTPYRIIYNTFYYKSIKGQITHSMKRSTEHLPEAERQRDREEREREREREGERERERDREGPQREREGERER